MTFEAVGTCTAGLSVDVSQADSLKQKPAEMCVSPQQLAENQKRETLVPQDRQQAPTHQAGISKTSCLHES